jgi:DNA invertase Pin-like site-specific DNA recombinase
MTVIGYARVSTQDQDLSAQLEALRRAGAKTVYREKVSGVRADRPQLTKLMASLHKGDVVLVTKLDRLGRSTRELLDLIHRIDKAGAAFRALVTRCSTPARHKAACSSPCSRPLQSSSES